MRRMAAVAVVVLLVTLVAPAAMAQEAGVGADLRFFRIAGPIAAFLAIALLGVLFLGPSRSVERRLRLRLGSYAADVKPEAWRSKIPFLGRIAAEAEEAARRRNLLNSINTTLEQANLPLQAGEAMGAALVVSIIVGAFAGLLTQSLIVGGAAMVVAILLFMYTVQSVASRERRRFENQLPDTLNLLATSMRAGYSLLQSVEAVSEEANDPTGREFSRAITEIRLGQDIGESLRGVAERMDSIDFEWAVMAIDIQREVGGNLAEVLTTAARTLLERNRLRRDVKAMTAEGRISAIVLSSLPFLMLGFLFTANRDYLNPLFETTLGKAMLVGAGVMMLAGVAWLRKIVDIEI